VEQGRKVLERENILLAQLETEKELGRMIEIAEPEASKEWKSTLRLAGLMVQDKTDNTVRIIHDGTHHCHVNPSIVVNDQARSPTIGEKRLIMGKIRAIGGPRFGMKGDVSGAHRLVKTRREDWGSQGFKLQKRVFVNTVGTQGIGSAAMWWARLIGAAGRMVYHILGTSNIYQLIYADDFDWTAYGEYFELPILVAVLFLEVAGLPWAWPKFAGGLAYEWVGFWTDWERFMVGVSEKRSWWLADWCDKKLKAGAVVIQEVTEVLGRMVFATQAVSHIKPLLGPLYAWVSVLDKSSCLPLPLMIRLIFLLLRKIYRDESMRMSEVIAADICKPRGCFRADARAEGDVVEAGGWDIPPSGDPKEARWFHLVLDRSNAKWAFHAGEPYRSIASIELFTTLLSVILFDNRNRDGIIQLSCIDGQTDNRGNTFAISKMLTTKYPLCIILMELAVQLHRRGITLDVSWIPREQNVEADEISNGVFRNFDPALQVKCDLSEIRFEVLDDLMEEAANFYGEMMVKKNSKVLLKASASSKKRRIEDKLRSTDPW
jgi:hypothetical protein